MLFTVVFADAVALEVVFTDALTVGFTVVLALGLAVVVVAFLVREGVGVGFLVAALALLLNSANAIKAITTFLNPDPI